MEEELWDSIDELYQRECLSGCSDIRHGIKIVTYTSSQRRIRVVGTIPKAF